MSTLHIKNIIQTFISIKNNWKIDLLKHWPDIIGKLKVRVTLEKIEEDSIILGVADACWLQELYMLSPLLCSLINKKLDNPRIKRIRFKKVAVAPLKKKKLTYINTIVPERKKSLLSAKEQKALTQINDLELQEALKNFHSRLTQGD